MGTRATRKDIPPWVKVPEDLEDPEVLLVHDLVLRYLFGPQGSRMPHLEKVTQAMFEVETLKSSKTTQILIYGSENNKVRAKWILQSMAERCRQRQERGMLMLQEALQILELDSDWTEASLQSL
ncbi:developmental pluripotency-associated 5 protein [Apodemus sylvaticus]|uniref:developmental pluripotency-associated 5 protein n=1 Tax=Apodemus sylvaticus TaxID=10129 RepID=UPI00224495A6|nr:developmental pluripotency-associated 5 protein [Apodemus sylvaticus]